MAPRTSPALVIARFLRRVLAQEAARLCAAWQDDAKEAVTTSELLEEAPIEELLEEKREAEEQQRLKASLSRAASKAAQDPWEIE